MMLQQQPKSATDAAALLLFTSGHVSEETSGSRPLWIYKDHHGHLQGPFSAANMLQWYNMQRLPPDLLVCGITAQTAQLQLNAIPAKFFQPLSTLISSTAAGMQYTPLSMAKAPGPPVPLPHAQSMPVAAQMHHATNPQANAVVGGAQMLMQVNNNSNQQGQQVFIGAAGGGAMLRPGVRQVATQQVIPQQAAPMQQQQQMLLQQLTQQPQPQQHQFVQGMTAQQTMVAAQRPVVLMQPVQQQQQVHVQQMVLPGQVVAQPAQQAQATQQVLLQQMQGGAARVPQVSTGGMMASTHLQSQQPVQAVVRTQAFAAQPSAGLQQVAMPQAQQPHQQLVVAQQLPQQQQQQPVAQQQTVVMQPQQAQAASGMGVGPVAASVSPDMLMGQQLLERQLQQGHAAGRKSQFGACAVAAQAKQYPGAETIQQRLQNVQSIGPEGAAAAHLQQRLVQLAAVGQQPTQAQSLAAPQSNVRVAPVDLLGQQQQQQQGALCSGPSSVGANATPVPGVVQAQLGTAGHLQQSIAGSGPPSVPGASPVAALTQMPGLLGPHVPTVPSRPGPASAGAISATAGTPRATGMVALARLSGSSFNNLQQLVKQVATGAVSNDPGTGTPLSLSAPGMHVATGPGSSGASADMLAKLAAAAMGTGAASTSPEPASTSTLPAASSLLGMAEGIDKALQDPAAPTSAAATAQEATPTSTAAHAAGVSSLEDVDAAIDDILLDLVADVETAAAADSVPLPSTQVAQQAQATEQAAAASTTTAASVPAAAALAISSSALASGTITPEAVAAALPAVASGAAAKAMSPLQAQTQAALAQRAAHQIEMHNTTGQRASDFLQQQLAQQQLHLQQQGAQASLAPSSQLLSVLGSATGMPGTLQQGLRGAAGPAGPVHTQNLPVGLTPAQQQQGLQHQQLLTQAQAQAQVQKQQQLLAQQQQQQLLLQQQQQQQKLLAQAQAQQAQQQQQKLLIQQQQQLLAEQQRLQQQQQLREQLARLQQQQQQQLLAQQQRQQQQLQAQQQAQQQQLQAQQQVQLQSLSHAQLQVPSIPQTQQIQLIQQGTSAMTSSSLGLAAAEEAAPQALQPQQQTQQAADALLKLQQQVLQHQQQQQGMLELPSSQPPASPVSAGQSTQSAAPSASSLVVTATEQTRQFNPFGMSFMDPPVMAERPKTREKLLQLEAQTAEGQQQAQQGQHKPAQQLSEQQQQEIMAALMPELAAMGLTTDQQLEVLKKMLGLKQQQMETRAQAEAAPQQQQHQQPSAQASGVSSAAAATPVPVPAPAAPAQPPPKPQHVWLQQLAAGKAAGDAKASASAATAGGDSSGGDLHDSATSAGAAEPGSDGEGEFDPSMLPADLFDFLDGHNSPKHLQPILPDDDALLAESAASLHAWPGDAPQGTQDDQQQATSAEAGDKPGKYVPPSLRRLSAGGSSDSSKKVGDREPRASSGSVQYTAQPAADVQLCRKPSVGAYQPPHARERGVSPPPAGCMARTSNGGSGWRDDRLAVHTTPEQEQRILEQQQRLPPHLRIVPPEAPSRISGGDDVKDAIWPPPPPPPPAARPKQPEPDAAETGCSKIKRLLDKAAAAVHSPRAAHLAPPPPPPMRQSSWEHGVDRDKESYHEGAGSTYGRPQQKRPDVPPGFEAPASPRTAWGEHDPDYQHRQYRQQQQQGDWREPGSRHHDEWYGEDAAGAHSGGYGSRGRERPEYDEAAYWDEQDSRERGRGASSYGRGGDDNEYEPHYETHEHVWNAPEEEPRLAPQYGSKRNPAAGAGSQWQRASGRRAHSPPPRTHSRDGEGWDTAGPRGSRYDRYQEHEYEEQEPYRPYGQGLVGRSRSHHQNEGPYDDWSDRPSRGGRADSHHDEWYEGAEESSRPSRRASGVARPRRASSREAEVDNYHDHSMTWQQKLLGDEHDAAGGISTKPAWLAAATAGKEREGREGHRDAMRHRERSPVDGRRTASMYDSHPAAPQPSQHLRAAAHTRLKQTGSDFTDTPHLSHPAPYADFLKQLKGEGKQQHSDWAGDADDAAWPSESPVTSPSAAAGHKEAVAASAAAAAMAAVQGLKPFCTVAPPRAGKAPVRKGEAGSGRGPTRTGSLGVAGIQLPSVEETQAAVMAALGAGPSGPSRTSSANSEQLPPQQDTGSFWRANSSSSTTGGGPDSRECSLTSGQQPSADTAGTSAPKRGASLFSNVIGQLRKQATTSTSRNDSSCDMEGLPMAEAAPETDQAPRPTSRAYTSSYAAAVSHSTAPPQPSSYLAAASSRRSGSDNAADIVLAAIQTTRQRAHAVSSRAQAKTSLGRPRQSEDNRGGKADDAWRDSDTGSAWDNE